jgi:4-hydroxythreonine-4-phosphate dehydrogenase
MTSTRIGITLGDPSGIGPEIVAATLAAADPALRRRCVVFGDAGVLARAGLPPGLPGVDVEVVPVTALAEADAPPGRPTAAGAAAQVAYLEAAVAAARASALGALVTAPISKTQVKAAGFAFPGHTEFLAERLGSPGRPVEHAMMFVGPTLRVVLATIHVPLAAVPYLLTPGDVARAVFLGGMALVQRLGVARPRIGVLGLNPHAGEGGLFGDEELRIVAPGIAAGRARLAAAGVAATVAGPLVPDAAYRGAGAVHDLFVALYHDQGLIPVKLVDFELAVNVTLGLPIVRTSPDHGVAYDIAGAPGRARPASFAAALRLAAEMAAAVIG